MVEQLTKEEIGRVDAPVHRFECGECGSLWAEDRWLVTVKARDAEIEQLRATLESVRASSDTEADAWVEHLASLMPISDGAKGELRREARIWLYRVRAAIDDFAKTPQDGIETGALRANLKRLEAQYHRALDERDKAHDKINRLRKDLVESGRNKTELTRTEAREVFLKHDDQLNIAVAEIRRLQSKLFAIRNAYNECDGANWGLMLSTVEEAIGDISGGGDMDISNLATGKIPTATIAECATILGINLNAEIASILAERKVSETVTAALDNGGSDV